MIRKIGYRLWLIIAVLTIVMAVAISVARFSLPFLDEYRDELITYFSEQLDQPLEVTTIVAEWHGMGPRIRLVGLVLLDKESGMPLLVLNNIVIGIDALKSILTGALQINSVILDGIGLSITRDEKGNISVQGLGPPGADAAGGKGGRLFAAWLLSRDHIAISANQIKWQDRMRGGATYHIRELNIELRNDRNRHQLDGVALLPEFEDQRIFFAADFRGDILRTNDWNGKIYIEARGVRLGQLPEGLFRADLRSDRGVAETKLWLSWRRGALQSVTGRARIDNLAMSKIVSGGDAGSRIRQQFVFDSASSDFLWKRKRSGWALALQGFQFERAGRRWPRTDLQFSIVDGGPVPQVVARLSYMDILDAMDLATFLGVVPEKVLGSFEDLRPMGHLYDVSGRYAGQDQFDVSGDFSDLGIIGDGKLPRVSGISGGFQFNAQSGMLRLSSTATRVAYHDVLRLPLLIEHIDGDITWKREGLAWIVEAQDLHIQNQDLQLRASAVVEWPEDDTLSPWVDLLASFAIPDVSKVRNYLPAGVMKRGLVKWFDHALIAGEVSYGEAMFYGPLRAFPFANDEGIFEVRLNAEDGILEYAPGWPRLEDVAAEIVFNGTSMDVDIARGVSLASDLEEARVSIADLAANPALLKVEGAAEGPASDVLRYLLESPLNRKFGPYFGEAEAGGLARMKLQLEKRLAPGTLPEIDGRLDLEGGRLLLSRDGLSLEDIIGELQFTQEGLYAHDIEATVLGMKADFNVQTAQEAGQTITHIYAVGSASAEKIAELLVAPLFGNMEGEALWNAAIAIPPARENGRIDASLVVQSDLAGLAIGLPFPLNKKPEEILDMKLNIPLPRSRDAPLTFRLGKLLHGVLDVDESMSIERGEIVFGDDMARLPDHYGLRLSGSTPFFSFSEWVPYLEDEEPDSGDDEQSLVRSVSMEMGQVELFGHAFHNAEVRALWRPEYWDISAISRELKGDIEYPRKEGRPLVLDLDYLHIGEAGEDGGDDMDPRDMPELRVNSRAFTLYDANLGTLSLHATPRSRGMHIDRMSLKSEVMSITATGDWLINEKNIPWSDFNAVIDSSDLGRALTQLGYVESIEEGKGHIEFSARWQGSPMSFSREKAAGSMSLRIENGRLVDIEPGAGRIFGLVNLRALPRRLSLDFSDLFNKGFAFDSIRGDFVFSRGIASTRDLRIKGPAAKVEIEGKIDLVRRSYDQVVTVMPEVSSGLPVAGAVVGGVGVGAAILLAEQLFKPEIEKATRVKYSVKGPWDDPVVTPLQ
ncbi:MAG TPA: TIGR02099 family protein [Gammaproteobacteria bacterium]|nr:TIGR02099 family protein [Gammaproteobacteria bacterium]